MDDKNARLESEGIAGRVGDLASSAANTVRDKVSNAAGSVREAAVSAAGTVREAAVNAAGTVREGAANAAGTVREGATSAAGVVREATGTAAGNIRAAAADRARDLAECDPAGYLRANPAQSAMLAAGIGGLAWVLCGPRRSHRGGRRTRRPLRRFVPGDLPNDRSGLGDSRVQYDAGAEYGRLGSSEARRMATSGGRGTDEWGGTEDWAGAPRIADDPASSSADEVARRAGDPGRPPGSQLRRPRNGHPLLIGAAAAILGAIVGAAISETLRENAWLGEAHDSREPSSVPPWPAPGGFGGVA